MGEEILSNLLDEHVFEPLYKIEIKDNKTKKSVKFFDKHSIREIDKDIMPIKIGIIL